MKSYYFVVTLSIAIFLPCQLTRASPSDNDVDDAIMSALDRFRHQFSYQKVEKPIEKEDGNNGAIPRADRPCDGELDMVLANIRVNVTELGLDPLKFPSSEDTFTTNLFNLPVEGVFGVSNIRLGGISTVHRTGECTLNLIGREGMLSIGGNDILVGFDVLFGFGVLKTKLQLQLLVSHVDLTVGAKVTVPGLNVKLTEFRLNEIGRIKFDIKGIPGGGGKTLANRLNLISNLAKDSLIYAFQQAIRSVIEKLLPSAAAHSAITDLVQQLNIQ